MTSHSYQNIKYHLISNKSNEPPNRSAVEMSQNDTLSIWQYDVCARNYIPGTDLWPVVSHCGPHWPLTNQQ